MIWKVAVVLLAVGIGASSAALLANNYPGCYPKFTDDNPRPDCNNEQMEGWILWGSMNYKYFAKKLTYSEAFDACDPWDEAVCEDEWPDRGAFRCHPVSNTATDETAEAVLPAYRQACIKNGNRFWTGGKAVRDSSKGNKLVFSDGSSMQTDLGRFDEGEYCVAFEVGDGENSGQLVRVDCDTLLPYMCRISPVSH